MTSDLTIENSNKVISRSNCNLTLIQRLRPAFKTLYNHSYWPWNYNAWSKVVSIAMHSFSSRKVHTILHPFSQNVKTRQAWKQNLPLESLVQFKLINCCKNKERERDRQRERETDRQTERERERERERDRDRQTDSISEIHQRNQDYFSYKMHFLKHLEYVNKWKTSNINAMVVKTTMGIFSMYAVCFCFPWSFWFLISIKKGKAQQFLYLKEKRNDKNYS